MPAGTEQDFDALFAQEVPGLHDVVDVLDLVVDVLDAGARRGEQRQRVVRGVDAQQRRIADPVGDARVAEARPELLVARRVGGVEADMAELGHAGVAAGKVSGAAVERLGDEFDAVAGRVVRGDECLDAALVAFLARADMHAVAGAFQFGADGVERGRVVQVETDGLIGGVAFEINHGVVACVAAHGDLVAAEIRRLALTGDELQADDVGGEADRAVEVGRADAHVTDIVQVDHG